MKISCARNIAVMALATVVLAGCLDDTQATGPIQTVKWFKANNDDRKVTLEQCANNPGELQETPNCKNALEAEKQLSSGSLKKVENW